MLKNIVMMLVCVFTIAACGGSSSTSSNDDSGDDATADTAAPTISTITDAGSSTDIVANASAVLSGTTSAAIFTITFSEAMDATTITTDNILFGCNGGTQEITLAASGTENTTWTITPSTDLPGYSQCGITIETGVKDAAGNALAAQVDYRFSTYCGTSDNFDVDTLGFTEAGDTMGNCWQYNITGSPLPSNSSTSFTVNTLSGELEFLSPADSDSLSDFHYLTKTFNASSFVATLEIVGMSTGGGLDCSLIAQDSSGGTQNASVVMSSGANCQLNINGTPGVGSDCNPIDAMITSTTPLYLQLTWDGTVATGKQGPSLSSLTALDSPGSNTTSLGSSYQVGFKCAANTASKFARVGSFTIDAVATGPGTQY